LQTLGIGDVGADGDRRVSGEMRRFFAGRSIDIGDGDAGAFAREQKRGGAADPGAAAGDECLASISHDSPVRLSTASIRY
jgi:hypothetical protein